MMRRRIGCWLGLTAALALPLTLPSASSARIVPTNNAVYIIEADSRSPEGHLRVGVYQNGVQAPAVLQPPITHLALRSLRHRQYWRAIVIGNSNEFQLRNLWSDMCLTVARPEHSPVYLQYCGSTVLGQRWLVGLRPPGAISGTITSGNFCPSCDASMCLDITEFRNARGTRLQVGGCHGEWNQLWKIRRVSEAYVK